jgi:putative flippase GtrA
MKAIHEASHQDSHWGRPQWDRRAFDVPAGDERVARLCKEKSVGKISRGALGQFARFCVVGTSNAVIDFGVLNAALAVFPTRATAPLLAYNSAAVVLAATNSFVWNRRFTFRVRGPLQAGEVVRFAVVAIGTAGLNDLVLLALSGLFPALMASGALGANVLKLGAILGAMALSFFGMRCWVFFGRRLSSDSPANVRGLLSSSDKASKDHLVQESLSVAALKQPMEVEP